MAEVEVGDLVTADLLELMNNPPMGRILASGTQSLTHNVAAAMAFGAEDIDTHSFHDIVTNNSRVTPTTGYAGYYTFTGTVCHGSRADYGFVDCFFRKSGVTSMPPGARRQCPTIAGFQTVSVEVQVALDPASSDYMELMGLQFNGASAAQVTAFSGTLITMMQWKFERPL